MTTPKKPHPDYPLTPRADGRWCKRVNKRVYYFTGTAQEALTEWLRVKDSLIAGRSPPPKDGEYLSVMTLCNVFLTWKQGRLNNKELAQRTLERYRATCAFIIERLGKQTPVSSLRAQDFEELREAMAKRWKMVALANEIGYIRGVFKYASDTGLVETPILFGPGFTKPSQKSLRAEKRSGGNRLFTPEQIHKLLKVASVNMRAMILLGINGGLGNTDMAKLPISAVDLKTGWLDYPRTKTGIDRRVPLWKETIAAIRVVLKHRRKPADPADESLLFIGRRGEHYQHHRVSHEFALAASKAVVMRTFYDLRRTFQTIGDGCLDIVAVGAIMGHAPLRSDMAATYRQGVSDERLRNVVSHIHRWLFSHKGKRQGSVSRKAR